MKKAVLFFICLFFSLSVLGQSCVISGYIHDEQNGEALIGVTVYIKSLGKGITTNLYGFYSLEVPAGTYQVTYSYVGYDALTQEVKLNKNHSLNLKLKPSAALLNEVVISAESQEKQEEVQSTQMGMIKLPMERLAGIPSIGGEVDVIKVMQLMPGVKRGGEGQTGMFVRGGDADQNLILLDEAVVYNVAHLFGFFSVFNTDALKDVTLIKGGFPASYGGRLSSVMDIRMKEGNMQKFNAEGGIGLLSSRLTIEGPIKKDTISFIVSGRRSYIDQVFKATYGGKNVLPYYFYDLNTKLNWKLSHKDRVYLSTYVGNDVLKVKAQGDSSLFKFGFVLGNFTTTLRWNHLYSDKLFSNISLIHTRFKYDVNGSYGSNALYIGSSIRDIGAKVDYDYYRNAENHLMFGGLLVNHNFRPNVISTAGEITEFLLSKKPALLSTQEGALYILNDKTMSPLLKINYGGRLSVVHTEDTVYAGLEPRLSATRSLTENSSLKAGYSLMKQYTHLVSSSSIALPTDLWYPVTNRIRPQSADQLAFGYTHHFRKIKSMFTAEAYCKWMRNLIEYREGAVLILNDNFENEIVSGKGKSCGLEFFLNRTSGRLSGWVSYSISWATRQFDALNGGKTYFAKYDRRHDISLVGTYEMSKRWNFSFVWVFATGSRFTPVVGNYFMPNATLSSVDVLPIYSEKNAIQLPASHRLDINFVRKSREGKRWKSEWHFGAYNFYNRAQPYRITVVADNKGGYRYQAEGLFGFIPSIAYNFSF